MRRELSACDFFDIENESKRVSIGVGTHLNTLEKFVFFGLCVVWCACLCVCVFVCRSKRAKKEEERKWKKRQANGFI